MAALPNAPALRVVGRDGTQAQQQVMDATRAQAYARPQDSALLPPVGLAGFVTDQYSLMRRHRDTMGRGWSDRLLASLRAFNGIYDTNVIQEIKKFGGSDVFARIIAMKCRGTSSLLRDVYLGTDKPWGLEPSSDPDVPDEIIQAIAQHIGETVSQQIKAHFDAQSALVAHQMGTAAAHAVGAGAGHTPGDDGRCYSVASVWSQPRRLDRGDTPRRSRASRLSPRRWPTSAPTASTPS